jgi:hypothetical protein
MKLATGTQAARHGHNPSGVSNDADVPALCAAMTAAINGAGEGTSPTQVVVSDGGAVTVMGKGDTQGYSAVAKVAGGVLTKVEFVQTTTCVVNAGLLGGVTVSGSGTKATAVVTNGQLTGITLST